jgi:hypothetical protein
MDETYSIYEECKILKSLFEIHESYIGKPRARWKNNTKIQGNKLGVKLGIRFN